MTKPTYDTHRRRAIEPDGTVHAARYAGDRQHFTLACAVYPMPDIERLAHDGNVWTVTCEGCRRTALAVVITCPLCQTPGAEEFGLPIPNTDDAADCARCTKCGHTWALDPGANCGCTECGGSGHTGRGTYKDPVCAPCRRTVTGEPAPCEAASGPVHDDRPDACSAGSLTTAGAVPAVDRAPEQPACALCRVTEINFVRAAAAGWQLVLGRLACAFCTGRSPAWMRRRF